MMNKVVFLILLLMTIGSSINAQIFSEWFQQKKTQKKYLVEQIAAFEVYAGYLKEGYTVAKKGLTAINNIKDGDFNLHTNHFQSFNSVNHRIINDLRIDVIKALDVQIIKISKGALKDCRESTPMHPDEVHYVQRVFTNLIQECKANTTLLSSLISGDQMQLTDDQRLKRVDEIYQDMQEKYVFAKSFANQIQEPVFNRKRDKKEIENERSVLNVKR